MRYSLVLSLSLLGLTGCVLETPAPTTTYVTPVPRTTYVTPAPTTTYVAPSTAVVSP
jgi:hypothetical protein